MLMKMSQSIIRIIAIITIINFGTAAACDAPDQAATMERDAPPASADVPREQAEADIRETHDAYLRTLVEEGSDAALMRYYGDDFTYVGVDGKIIDKSGLRARMRQNELQHIELEDDLRRVSVYGDVVVLSGHSTSTGSERGREFTTTEGYTEVWIRRDGRWQLVAEQITLQN